MEIQFEPIAAADEIQFEPIDFEALTGAPTAQPETPPSAAEPEGSFLERAGARYQRGSDATRLDLLSAQAADGKVSWDDVLAAESDFLTRWGDRNLEGGNWFSSSALGAAEMAPAMLEGTVRGQKYGTTAALAAGGLAAVAGQAGPQVAIPEELVTVPGLARAGYSIGTMYGAAKFWYDQGRGQLYRELRKDGVDHNVANQVATGAALPYSLIEFSQVGKIVPGLKRLALDRAKGTAKRIIARAATQYGKQWVEEMAEEELQAITQMTAQEIAYAVDDGITRQNLPPERLAHLSTLWNTAKESAGPMAMLLAPNSALNTTYSLLSARAQPPAGETPAAPQQPTAAPAAPTPAAEGAPPASSAAVPAGPTAVFRGANGEDIRVSLGEAPLEQVQELVFRTQPGAEFQGMEGAAPARDVFDEVEPPVEEEEEFDAFDEAELAAQAEAAGVDRQPAGGQTEVSRVEETPEASTPPATPTEQPTPKAAALGSSTTPSAESSSGVAAPSQTLADWVAGRVGAGTAFTWQELFTEADRAWGGTQSEGRYSVKDAYDAMELGVNQWVLSKMPIMDNPRENVLNLKRLIEQIPTQTKRTTEQDEFQQFSTPPPLAYVVNWVANVTPADTVMEPSAGVGGIAVFARQSGARVIVNELSPRRRALLEVMGFDQVLGENAEQLNNVLPPEVRPTVVVMNPPFSATGGRMQGHRKTKFGAVHIEQALKRLQPGGRLVAIVGEGMADDRPTFRAWWADIKRRFNVRANVGINGEEYRKYGTTFDNQILVIDNTGPTVGQPITGKVDKIEDLTDILTGVRNERAQPSIEPARKPVVATSRPTAGERPATSVPTAAVEPQPGGGTVGALPLGAGTDTGKPVSEGQPGGGAAVPDANRPGRRAGSKRVPGGARSDERSGTALAGTAQQAGGDTAELSQSGPEIAYTATARESGGELTDAVYDDYTPHIAIAGAKPHPTPLSESAAMAAVSIPPTRYAPKLPAAVVSDGRLSDAQLETVILAGAAHDQTLDDGSRRGFFIGDGTGVGKGREISGILLDNWSQGRRKHLWISEKAQLATDARRDMAGVGLDPDLLIELSKIKAGTPIGAGKGILFLSYDTLKGAARIQGNQGGQTRLQQVVDWLGPDFDGVIAFDEAHNMGNAIAMRGKRGLTKPAQKALAGIALQNALPKARVVYVSATGATEVSNLTYALRLGLWGPGTPFPTVQAFIAQIGSAGVAAMEKVAADMKALGLYLARNLNFKGVDYDKLEHVLTAPQREIYDALANAWQIVLRDINAALAETGGDTNARAKSAAMSAFWGAHQRFFNQVITSMKMPALLGAIERDIEVGHAVVLQLVNTNEAMAERAIAESQAAGEDLDSFDMTPRQQLMQLIERSFPTTQFETFTDENGNTQSRPALDSKGNPVQNADAVARRDALLDRLAGIKVPDAALEQLLIHFGPNKVAEVTGRKRRVIEKGGRKVVEKRGKLSNQADTDAFMGGKKNILVFSQAGGTGRSYHADLKAKNQRKRIHYLVQPGWRADTAVQGFGRTHRSNQKQPPFYRLLTSDLPGEKRFISSIARRLDQLGALTKGSRRTGGQGFFQMRDNLESDYARDALHNFILDLHRGAIPGLDMATFEAQTGLKLRDEHGSLNADLLPITTFLNRLLSLDIETMNRVFDAFSERMDNLIQQAIEQGTLDQGLENIKAQSTREIGNRVVYTEPKTGAETRHIELELTHPVTLTPWAAAERQAKQGNSQGYVRNIRSGKVWLVRGPFQKTDRDGSITNTYLLVGVRSQASHPQSELGGDKYEKLTPDQARPLWDLEYQAAPKTYAERVHMISGVILPIWDRLPDGHQRLVRAQTDDGSRFIGRLIPNDVLPSVLQRLGAELSGAQFSPEQAYDQVLNDNHRVALSNGWVVKRSLVSDEERVEIIGPDYTHTTELAGKGVFSERIGFKLRFFIPTGTRGPATLADIARTRPIIDSTPPSGRRPTAEELGAAAEELATPQQTAAALLDDSATEAQRQVAQDRAGAADERLRGLNITIGSRRQAEAGFLNLPQIIADLTVTGARTLMRGGQWTLSRTRWMLAMTRQFGDAIRRYLDAVWTRLMRIQNQVANHASAITQGHINAVENLAGRTNIPAEEHPLYDEQTLERGRGGLVRALPPASVQIKRMGGQDLLAAKQRRDIEEATQAEAVKRQSDELWRQLRASSAQANRLSRWHVPEWIIGTPRARRFKERALHIAARLNATGRDPAGNFVFAGFRQRMGTMSTREFHRNNLNVGDVIQMTNPATGQSEPVIVGPLVTTPEGRAFYQLYRDIDAQTQRELYDFYQAEYPELLWFLDMFIDPALTDTRVTINGIEIPVFNRFAAAAMMADADPTFTPLTAYTPDVLVSRSLIGSIAHALTGRGRSPGRRYKTGTSRESGHVRDLLSGFNIRTHQMLAEQSRREWSQAILNSAVPIQGGVVPEGFTKLESGMDNLWQAVKRLRRWHGPVDPATGNPVFPETEARMTDDGSPEYRAFFGEAARLRGRQLMIPERLIQLLARKYAAQRTHGILYRTAAWFIRNSVRLFLVMPRTYVQNVLTNDLFALEAMTRRILSGALGTNMQDLRFARELAVAETFKWFPGLRRLVDRRFRDTVDQVLPTRVFEEQTRLADLKMRLDESPWAYLRQGEIGAAALNLIRYGQIDIVAKQRMAYAWLKAMAVTNARRAGLRGSRLRNAVDAYLRNPPLADRARAVEVAAFELLNYADSPQWLEDFSRNEWSRLVLPFPRFGYHYIAKNVRRAAALRDVLARVPRQRRADAFADFITFLMWPAGGLGILAAYGLKFMGDDDDDEDKDARELVGTSFVKTLDDEGNVVSKPVDRNLITVNRMNLSAWARQLGLGGDNEEDFWLRVRSYPVISMAGAAILAENDVRKFGLEEGVKSYANMAGDLAADFFSVGMALKVPSKVYTELAGRPGDRVLLDPYAVGVPTTAYVTDQTLDSFLPGSRQADMVIHWVDPVHRRRRESKQLEYEPGVWDAARVGHWTGLLDRMFTGESGRHGPMESSLPAEGEIWGGRVVDPREIDQTQRVGALLGVNIKPVNRLEYEEAVAGR